MSTKDERHVESAEYHLAVLREYISGGTTLDDAILFDAICLRLSASIEAVAKVSKKHT